MLRDRAILDLPEGDIGAPDDPVQGRFILAGNLNIAPSFRTGFIIGGRGSLINNVIQQVSGDGNGEKGQGIFIDLGDGAHVIEVEFRGWKGAQVPSGYDADGKPTGFEPAQWGNTGDETELTYADATGAHPQTQVNVLEQYLRNLRIDSSQTATLQYGEFSTDGMYGPLDVVLEGPQMTRASEDASSFDGSLTLIEAAAIEDIASAVERTG